MTHPATAPLKTFAAILGCKPSYVTALKKAGRLVLTEDGKQVRVAESLARIEATRDPSMAGVAARHAQARGAELAAPAGGSVTPAAEQGGAVAPPQDPDEPDADESPDYQRWRARKERAVALREEMKLAEEAGELVRREDAAAVVASAFTTLRTTLESLPDSIAPVLAGETDETRVRALLTDEIEHALGNCATEVAKLGKREG